MSIGTVDLEPLLSLAREGADERLLEHLERLDAASLAQLEAEARAARGALPAPIGPRVRSEEASRHRGLGRIVGWLEARRGDSEGLVAIAREQWLSGASHLTYLRLLIRIGRADEALLLSRSLLDAAPGSERRELEQVMAEAAGAPEGWAEAVRALALEPTPERWRALQRFTPEASRRRRQRYTIRLLLELGTDPDAVFALSALDGASVDTIELAEKGAVAAETIVAHAARLEGAERALWLGLAARAASARGQRSLTVRLLREARELAPEAPLDSDLRFIRARADAELHALLDGAALPRFGS